MPRPAIPKPGYSLLRLHNSQNPHIVAKLSPTAKTTLINSIAQDIEGCIWAVGQYIRLGVLDASNTLEFDHVINDIHREEREEMEKLLQKMVDKMEAFKQQAKTAKRQLKRFRAKRRQERRERQERKLRMRDDRISQEGRVEPIATGTASCVQAALSDLDDHNSDTGVGKVSSEAESVSSNPTQSIEPVQALPSPVSSQMEVDDAPCE